MKLTNWKISKAISLLPEEDRKMVKEEMASPNGISSENMSRIQKMVNSLSTSKGKNNGAFGKRGSDRKSLVASRRKDFIEKLKKAQEEFESENKDAEE